MKRRRRRGDSTTAVHGDREGNRNEPLTTPIVQAATFVAASQEAVDDLYEGRASGHIYTRYSNPTTEAAARRIALLEGGEECLVTASGMAAITLVVLGTVRAGGRIVSVDQVYGGTERMFRLLCSRLEITVDRFSATDTDALERTLAHSPADLVYLESPTNPTVRLVDIAAVTDVCRAHGGVTVAIDSTFATPVNSKPLNMGVDVVLHSATKYLGGHSDITAGAVVASRERCHDLHELAKVLGATPDPFASFLLERGLKTLALRVRRANESAQAIAEWLEAHGARVARVHYPGLPSHAQHELAKRQMPGGYGGVLAFELEGGEPAARAFADALRVFRNAASLGGVESLVSLPILQSHRNVPRDELARSGVTPGTVRLAVGVEDVEDLISDVERALEAVP